MLTTDDLKNIRGVIREEINSSETKIRGEITSLETKLHSVIREVVDKRAKETELKMELRFNAVDKRFEGIDKQLAAMKKQMEQDRKDWSEFFNQAGIFFDEMRTQLSKRIKKLEANQRVAKN